MACGTYFSHAHTVHFLPSYRLPCMVHVCVEHSLAISDLKDMVRALTSSDPTQRLATEAKREIFPFMQVKAATMFLSRGPWSRQYCRAESRCRMGRQRRRYPCAPQRASFAIVFSCVWRGRGCGLDMRSKVGCCYTLCLGKAHRGQGREKERVRRHPEDE